MTNVEVVDKSSKDLAISAHLGQATQLRFAEEFLEFLDHAVGTTVNFERGPPFLNVDKSDFTH